VSGQRHAPAALYPRGKSPWYPLDRRLGGLQNAEDRKIFCLCRGSNPDRPVRSQTLYWLSYSGSQIILWFFIHVICEVCLFPALADISCVHVVWTDFGAHEPPPPPTGTHSGFFPRRELPVIAEVKNSWSFTSTAPCVFKSWCVGIETIYLCTVYHRNIQRNDGIFSWKWSTLNPSKPSGNYMFHLL
jgi:hypothetical protein